MFNFIRSLTVYTLYDIILMRNKTVYTYLRSFLLWQPWSFYQSDTSFSGQWVSVSPKPTCTRYFIERYKNIQCYQEYIYPKLTISNEHLSYFSQDERLFPTVKCLTIYKKQQFFCFRRALRQSLTNTILVSLYWCLMYVSKQVLVSSLHVTSNLFSYNSFPCPANIVFSWFIMCRSQLNHKAGLCSSCALVQQVTGKTHFFIY